MQHRLFIPLFFLLLFASTPKAQTPNAENRLLWRISGKDIKEPSYLYAALYSQDKRCFDFSDSTLWAFEHCNTYAINIDPDSFETAIYERFFKEKGPNKTLQNILSESQYKSVSERLYRSTGYTLDQTAISNPYVLNSLMDNSHSTGYGNADYSVHVNQYFTRLAKNRKKQILSLTSLDDIVSMNLYSESEISEILSYVPSYGYDYDYSREQRKSDSIFSEQLIQLYRKGDLNGLQQKMTMGKSMQRETAAHNHAMFETLQRQMQNGSIFICLDVASIAGPEGLVELLKGAGYKLELVNTSFNDKERRLRFNPSDVPWLEINSETFGYTAFLPVWTKDESQNKVISSNYRIYDPASTINYIIACSRLALDPQANEDDLVNDFLKNDPSFREIKELGGNMSKKKIVQMVDGKEVKGMEIGIKSTESFGEMKIQYYIRERQYVYILAIESYEKGAASSKDAERFFKTFRFNPLPKTAANTWQRISVPEKGFEFSALGEPVMKEEFQNVSDSSSDFTRTYTFVDPKDGSSYIVQVTDSPDRGFKRLLNGFKNMERDLKYENNIELLSERELSGGDFLGREYIANDNLMRINYRLIFRGNRAWTLVTNQPLVNSDSMAVQQFFSGLKFLPQAGSETKLYNAPERDFSILFPGTKVNKYPENKPEHYSITDPASAVFYEVQRIKLNGFKHFPDEDSMRRWAVKIDLIDKEDSVLWKTPIDKYKPYEAFDYGIQPKNSPVALRGRAVYVGNTIYLIKACTSPDSLRAQQVEQVLNSFQIKNASPNPRPTLDSRETVLEKILAEMGTLFKNSNKEIYDNDAFSEFRDFSIIQSDLPLLKAAVEKVSARDSFAFVLLHNYFDRIPDSLNIDDWLPVLQQLYKQDFLFKNKVKYEIRDFLANHLSEQTKAQYKQWLFESDPKLLSNEERSPLEALSYNKVKQADFLFPDILNWMEKYRAEDWYLNFIAQALDSLVISPAVLAPHWNGLQDYFLEQSEKLFGLASGDRYDYHLPNHCSSILRILKYHSKLSKQVVSRLQKLLTSRDTNFKGPLKQLVIEVLLKHSIKPDVKAIKEEISTSNFLAYRIFLLYHQSGHSDWYPGEKLTQEDVAREKLRIYAIRNSTNSNINEDYVDIEEVTIDGEQGFVYFFKCTNRWDENKQEVVYNLAIVGVFSDSKDLIGGDWKPIISDTKLKDEENLKEEKEKLIKELLEKKQ